MSHSHNGDLTRHVQLRFCCNSLSIDHLLIGTVILPTFNFTELLHSSMSPNMLFHGIAVHLQSSTTIASKYMSNLVWLSQLGLTPMVLDYPPLVRRQTDSITANNCTAKYNPLQPASTSWNTVDYCIPVQPQIDKTTAGRCISNQAQFYCTMPLKYISKFTQ